MRCSVEAILIYKNIGRFLGYWLLVWLLGTGLVTTVLAVRCTVKLCEGFPGSRGNYLIDCNINFVRQALFQFLHHY